ncbi:MAG: hypothetical protein WAM65_15855 [Candidatus Korobacteraceae bacterium]
MPESAGGSNIEVAHHLSERHEGQQSRAHEILEIVEAIVLAVVAIATAWSGYQAALWTGHQAELYSVSDTLRIQAAAATDAANEQRMYDALTVAEWLKAQVQGEDKLAQLFERRLLPEVRPAFEAWKQSDPLHNPNAPAGPQLMHEYHSAKTEEAARLNERAATVFEQGNVARRHSDDYVKATVMLATVLLLTAISQRFKTHGVRVGLAVIAALLLCLPVHHILTLPRA